MMPSHSEQARARLIKDNEIPPLPEGWDVQRFRFLFRESKERNGETPVGDTLSVSEYRGVVPKEYEHEEQRRADEELENYRVVRPGQLAVNTMWLNHLGLGVSDHLGHVSPAYAVYNISPELNARFAHHLLRSQYYLKIYLRYLYGIRPNSFQIKADDWNSIPVILPPQDTQKAIADFLDRETARIDQLIEKKQRLVALLEEKECSCLADMFSALNVRRWRLRHLGKVRNGAGFPVELQGDPTNEIAFFKVRHLAVYGLDAAISATEDTVSRETAKALRATIFPHGTIVFAKIGAALLMSRFSMLGREACIDNNMAAFIPNERIVSPHFALLSLSQIDMAEMAQPGAVPSLNTEAFYSHAIPLPPLDAQREFVTAFRTKRQGIQRVIEKTNLSVDRLREFRSALITAAVTGQIDVKSWGKQGQTDRRLDEIEEAMTA